MPSTASRYNQFSNATSHFGLAKHVIRNKLSALTTEVKKHEYIT